MSEGAGLSARVGRPRARHRRAQQRRADSSSAGRRSAGRRPPSPLTLLKSPLFFVALVAYALSVLTWLAVLRKVPLGVAMPFVALTYVAVPIAARVAFGDPISLRTVGGTALIIAGVLVVAVR